MRTAILFAFIVSATACVDSADTASGTAQQSAGSVCTGQLYDGCTSDDQCESGMCKLYSNRAVQTCTQTCDVANPCPAQDGVAVVCNNKGLCRPDAPNVCELP